MTALAPIPYSPDHALLRQLDPDHDASFDREDLVTLNAFELGAVVQQGTEVEDGREHAPGALSLDQSMRTVASLPTWNVAAFMVGSPHWQDGQQHLLQPIIGTLSRQLTPVQFANALGCIEGYVQDRAKSGGPDVRKTYAPLSTPEVTTDIAGGMLSGLSADYREQVVEALVGEAPVLYARLIDVHLKQMAGKPGAKAPAAPAGGPVFPGKGRKLRLDELARMDGTQLGQLVRQGTRFGKGSRAPLSLDESARVIGNLAPRHLAQMLTGPSFTPWQLEHERYTDALAKHMPTLQFVDMLRSIDREAQMRAMGPKFSDAALPMVAGIVNSLPPELRRPVERLLEERDPDLARRLDDHGTRRMLEMSRPLKDFVFQTPAAAPPRP